MPFFRLVVYCSAFFIVLIACEDRKPKDKYEFIEYIELRGTCRDDHVRVQPAVYTGDIEHWFNVTKNHHSRDGIVFGGVISWPVGLRY